MQQETPGSPIDQHIAERRANAVPWNPLIAVLYVITIFIVSQIMALVFLSLVYGGYSLITGQHFDENVFDNSVAAQFLFVLVAEALSIGAIVGFVKGYGAKLSIIGLKRPRWSDLAYALAAVPVYYTFYLITLAVTTSLVKGFNTDQQQDIGFNNVHGPLQLTLTFISLAVLPPLAEEILMRGFLYTSLKKAMRVLWAALLTSLLFAIAHLPEGGSDGPLYVAALDTFILSLVLIYLREKTGSLWASIGLHALKNTVAFLALFVFHA